MNGNKLHELTNSLSKKLDIGSADGLLDVLKNTAFKIDANDNQMAALLIVANQYSLNPWTREIYAFPDKNNGIVPIVGVDGWSRIINSHNQFDGMDFEQDEDKCTCKIYRKDRSHPISITEFRNECERQPVKKNGYIVDTPWQTHPKRMLRHKAMIQCARIAFGFTGIYDPDEAENIIEGSAVEINGDHIIKQEEKQILEKGTKHWERAVQSLKDIGSLDAVEKHMTISQEDKAELYALAEISDNPF